MRVRSITQRSLNLSASRKMGGYRPAYIDNSEQPSNSRLNSDRVLRRNERQLQQPAYQVDSWRSYRNDATNLQQMTDPTTSCYYGHTQPDQQPQWPSNQNNLNPAAPTFQPMQSARIWNPTRSQFTPYQPLRISNGQSERSQVYQARSSDLAADNRGYATYALRSQGPANPGAVLHDVPVPSTECQGSDSPSVHINMGTHPAYEDLYKQSTRRRSPSVVPPPTPSPAQEYLAQACLPPESRVTPQRLLVVVDLNGTLLKRTHGRGSVFHLRPGVTRFMEYLFDHHSVMIYTSSRPENAQGMVNNLLAPKQRQQLAALWARDKLDLNDAQYNAKVQVYKKLEKIWADEGIQRQAGEGRRWDQSNTVLIDDSHLKALAQPYNLLKVEEFLDDRPARSSHTTKIANKQYAETVNMWSLGQQKILRDLTTKLEQLKHTADVSRLIRVWQLADTDNTESINDESIEPEQVQLLTPKSPDSRAGSSDQHDGRVCLEVNCVNDFAQEMGSLRVKGASDRSVSPIDESVWRDILGDLQVRQDVPPTPKSVED